MHEAGFSGSHGGPGNRYTRFVFTTLFAFHAGAGWMTKLITSLLERLAAFFTTRFVVVSEGERAS
jgi:hypothetical protein